MKLFPYFACTVFTISAFGTACGLAPLNAASEAADGGPVVGDTVIDPPRDTGTTPIDSGPRDGGTVTPPDQDTGTQPVDAGSPQDAGSPPVDSGPPVPDAGGCNPNDPAAVSAATTWCNGLAIKSNGASPAKKVAKTYCDGATRMTECVFADTSPLSYPWQPDDTQCDTWRVGSTHATRYGSSVTGLTPDPTVKDLAIGGWAMGPVLGATVGVEANGALAIPPLGHLTPTDRPWICSIKQP